MRSLLAAVVVALLAAPAALAAPKLSLTLDWTPNPDHAGIYYASAHGLFAKRGLDVSVRAPSDPTAPLKLVAVGRSDLAVTYEQEVFLAAERKLPVVAVAAIVPRPLNSIIAIDAKIHRAADLRGRTIGITGAQADYAALDTALHSADLSRSDVKIVNVGYNLLPALLSHRVDAVLGVYRNVEGVELQQRGLKPTVIPLDRVGVPSYDELVLVASSKRLASDAAYRSEVKRAVAAIVAGTSAARRDPSGTISVMKKVTASGDKFLDSSVPATLKLLAGAGCMRAADWSKFGAWMHRQSLLKSAVPASAVMTDRYCR
jgi:putative hydroxymethylpyrimidine transport system substrate-binding protein